jgi:hypothetical protein
LNVVAILTLIGICSLTMPGRDRSSQTATSGDSKLAVPSALDQIKARGELRVGYLLWSPCVVRDPATGKLTGIYADSPHKWGI